MMRVPSPPFLIRSALAAPFLTLAGACLAVVAWLTPEVTR